ncbi:MAG TPA: transposase [Polyangiaceae bacterium]|nr:transposase [Polyangiaceae bacterium]
MAIDLTDEQWERIEPLLPKPRVRQDGRGRPWRDSREVMSGVLWVIRTGAPWADLPHHYPPYQTCHRRFQQWVRSGALKKVLAALGHQLSESSPLCRLDRPGFRPLLKGKV